MLPRFKLRLLFPMMVALVILTIYPSEAQATMRWAVSFPSGIDVQDSQIPTITLTLTNCQIGNSSSELRCTPAIATSASSAFSEDAQAYAESLRGFIAILYPATAIIFGAIAIPKVLRSVFSGL